MQITRNAMRIFTVTTFLALVLALEVGIFSPEYSHLVYVVGTIILLLNLKSVGSKTSNLNLEHGYYLVVAIAFLLQNTALKPLIGMIDIGLVIVTIIISYCLSYYIKNIIAQTAGRVLVLGGFFYLINLAFDIKVDSNYPYFLLTLLFAPIFALIVTNFKKNSLYLGVATLAIVAVNAFFTLSNLAKWGENGIIDTTRVSLVVGNILLIALSILIIKTPAIITEKKLYSVLTSFMVLLSVVSLVPTESPFSKVSAAASQKVIADQTRATSVAGYRLPGVGYKDALSGKTFLECDQGSTEGRDCFITYYVDLAKKIGTKSAVDDVILAMNSKRGKNLNAHCHQVTHALGQFAAATDYKKDPLSGLKLEPGVCATGYTHGIFQAFWEPYDNAEMKKEAPDACAKLGMVVGFYRWTCNHILGHELVVRDGLNPGPQLRACLTMDDDHSINDCLSGGWMQFFSDDPILVMFKSKNATAKDIFTYCDREVLRMQRMCYQETFPALSIIKNSNFTSEMIDCGLASDAENKKWCIQGVARAIAITGNYTVPFATTECNKLTGETRDYCLSASAASITLNMGSASDTQPMCAAIENEATKDYCYRWVRDSRSLIASGPGKENMPKN
jgi:hypothetical protein